jgi:glycosyltransferase involved in cell wall biosynthesis
MDISVVIPLYNEEESLPELCTWIEKVMIGNNFVYEIIFVDDGSNDQSWKVIRRLREKNASVKGIRFRRNYGKSAALNEGFQAARGKVIISMDADLQDSPDEIPILYQMIRDKGFDLVSGYKKKRYDPISKTLPTRLFNWVTRSVSGIYLHDFNCGLKAYRQDVAKSIEIYGELHRYIPLLAKWAGFRKIGEKVVEHRARKYGASKFGLSRFINGFLDLITVTVVNKYLKRPMHFFGIWGLLIGMLGFAILAYLAIVKLLFMQQLTERMPAMFLGTILLLLGVQLFFTGLLSELITRNSPIKNKNNIAEKI